SLLGSWIRVADFFVSRPGRIQFPGIGGRHPKMKIIAGSAKQSHTRLRRESSMKATPDGIGIRMSTLFDAVWRYEEFHRVEYLGPGNQAQAFGFTPAAGCRVDGERIAGSLRLVQFPQVRADGPLLPDAHGLIETDSGQALIVRAGGFAVPIPDTPGEFSIRHWMRFKTAAPELHWLN